MAIYLAAAITSFVICFLVVPVIIKYSVEKNIVDIPGRRKIHKKDTPSMGGIAIFFGFSISSLIWIDLTSWSEIKWILVALFVIFFIGVRDDLVPLRAILKLIGQILAATLLVLFFDLKLGSLYGIFGIFALPEWISNALTILTIIVITNSFNLIDGLDGLAGSIAIVALICFGGWFYLVGESVYAILSFTMLGAVFAFLIFNWEPSEVFMGDTGALVIGMFLSILAVHFINVNFYLPRESPFKFLSSIGTAICIIIIPLIDTFRIIVLRLLKGQSPFKPDKSHIHHAIMRLGMTHSQTTVILTGVHLFYIGMAVFLRDLTDRYVILAVLGLSVILSITLDRLILRKRDVKEVVE